MTICFFGNYILNYSRISVFRNGLNKNGVKIIECHTRERGIKKYLSLYLQHKKIKNDYDILLVCMGGQTLVWFAKILSRKKIYFDAFASLYVANVEDRKNCKPKSFKSYYYSFWDWFPCLLADKIILDTNAQINYFVKRYHISPKKFICSYVSADTDVFYPLAKDKEELEKIIIHWHGYIVPFYSLETVIKAAEILKEDKRFHFRLITRFDKKFDKIKEMTDNLKLTNVEFLPEVKKANLAEYIRESHVCLGVFGNTLKSKLVIPNKVFEGIACKKPVITADHEVIKELFTDSKDIVLCLPENPSDLALKIKSLFEASNYQNEIGKQAYDLFLKELTPEKVVGVLLNK